MVYVGEWHKGQIHVKGTLIYTNGDIYEGYWQNG